MRPLFRKGLGQGRQRSERPCLHLGPAALLRGRQTLDKRGHLLTVFPQRLFVPGLGKAVLAEQAGDGVKAGVHLAIEPFQPIAERVEARHPEAEVRLV